MKAAIISDIAHPDWPDDWPTLMSQLLQLISGTPDEVDGGMRVLNDFVGIDLTEDQLLPLARDMLPQLLVILGSPEVHVVIPAPLADDGADSLAVHARKRDSHLPTMRDDALHRQG